MQIDNAEEYMKSFAKSAKIRMLILVRCGGQGGKFMSGGRAPGRLGAWTPGRLDAWTPGRLDAWTPGHGNIHVAYLVSDWLISWLTDCSWLTGFQHWDLCG